MAYRIFISYSTKDLGRIRSYIDTLKSNPEIDVYLAEDEQGYGNNLAGEIIEHIQNCHLFVLFWSKKTKLSQWVNHEIGIAKSEGRIIVPIILDSGVALPEIISDIKHINSFEKPETAISEFQKFVLTKTTKHKQMSTLIAFSLGAALLYLFSKN